MIRRAGPGDRVALEDALVRAFNWSPRRGSMARHEVLARPDVAHYVAGWPAARDLGFVAVTADDGEPVGAAWFRYLPASDPGYGFVAEDVPELSLGVSSDHRGRGIGSRLLRTLLAQARTEGVRRVSLSVERENRARELYLREGFRVVGGDDAADTMVVELTTGEGDAAC